MKANLTVENIVKLLIAAAAVFILFYFLFSYFSGFDNEGETAEGILKQFRKEINRLDESENKEIKQNFIVSDLDDWYLRSYRPLNGEVPPKSECGIVKSCLCVCDNGDCSGKVYCDEYDEAIEVYYLTIGNEGFKFDDNVVEVSLVNQNGIFLINKEVTKIEDTEVSGKPGWGDHDVKSGKIYFEPREKGIEEIAVYIKAVPDDNELNYNLNYYYVDEEEANEGKLATISFNDGGIGSIGEISRVLDRWIRDDFEEIVDYLNDNYLIMKEGNKVYFKAKGG